MKKKIDYDNWSKDELIKEIKRIKETTYGLVWHRDLPEEKIDVLINPDARTPSEMFPNEMAGKPFPVLKEVKTKAIETDRNKPTNILIEGDNYHSLAVLSFTHQEAVDLIYIDPPYNTGNNDFLYNDSFVIKEDPYRHSKWLSFMEKRLKLAKNLLKKDGVIFISIDNNEFAQLKMLCDEIFGENNFVNNIIWKKTNSPKFQSTNLGNQYEFVLVYAKEISNLHLNRIYKPFDEKSLKPYSYEDSKGKFRLIELEAQGIQNNQNRKKTKFKDRTAPWLYSIDTLEKWDKEGLIYKTNNGRYAKKQYLDDMEGVLIADIWIDSGINPLQGSSDEYVNFETQKPLSLIDRVLRLGSNKNSIVVDFFAGSGTTGESVLSLNDKDGGNRSFILCTNNGDEKSEHKIASDVCYPRIKKSLNKYGGNLRYFTAYDFVEAKETDRNKRKLVNQSTEMLCIKESAFELVQEAEDFKIFRNHDKYLGIIFHEDSISDYVKAIKKIKGHFNTYTFSMTDDPHKEEFSEVEEKVTLCAIPEVILKVYREIFKE
jgi:adenine-specific DNA-methyltransferase